MPVGTVDGGFRPEHEKEIEPLRLLGRQPEADSHADALRRIEVGHPLHPLVNRQRIVGSGRVRSIDGSGPVAS